MIYQKLLDFPENFLWGDFTSAYQVEGGWDADGKSSSIIDMYEHPAGYADFTVASDYYHRYKEDIALFARIGLKAYRFSIAWTRILFAVTSSNAFKKLERTLISFLSSHLTGCVALISAIKSRRTWEIIPVRRLCL